MRGRAARRVTGVLLRRLTSVHDTGRVLNPIGFRGQIDGGVTAGIGFALSEEMIMDEGRITNPPFADFKIPTIRDIPELRTVMLESEDGMGPYGRSANTRTSPLHRPSRTPWPPRAAFVSRIYQSPRRKSG
jgi:hypothetical protein